MGDVVTLAESSLNEEKVTLIMKLYITEKTLNSCTLSNFLLWTIPMAVCEMHFCTFLWLI